MAPPLKGNHKQEIAQVQRVLPARLEHCTGMAQEKSPQEKEDELEDEQQQ